MGEIFDQCRLARLFRESGSGLSTWEMSEISPIVLEREILLDHLVRILPVGHSVAAHGSRIFLSIFTTGMGFDAIFQNLG